MKRIFAMIVGAALLPLAACDRKPAAAPMPAGTPVAPVIVGTPTPAQAGGVSADEVSALGLTFKVPNGWTAKPPANTMRLAELHLPDSSGDPSKACIAVFSSAGGGVEANIARWAGQVRNESGQPATPTVSTREVAGMNVHFVEISGAFSPGMGDTRTYQNWTVRGAIIETPRGLLFIKVTGPAEAMAGARAAFEEMVASLRA